MTLEWWIIGGLVYWLVSLNLVLAIVYWSDRKIERDEIKMIIFASPIFLPVTLGVGVSTLIESSRRMMRLLWLRYGPDSAVEKEDL